MRRQKTVMSKKQDIFQDDESIEKDSPLLHSISKENPFSVPENYFEGLPSQIIEKAREEVTSRQSSVDRNNLITHILYLISLYKWRLLTSTCCAVVICIFAIRLNSHPVSYEAMAQNIPDSLIVEHLDNNIASINESTLEDLSETNPENVKSQSDSTSTDQDIIAFLVDNNVSVTEIVNEP